MQISCFCPYLQLCIALGCFASVAQAGVGILSLQEEDDALQLFNKLCGSRSEGGDFGGARVWCKFGPGEHVEVVNHNVEVPSPIIPDNVVFVQPPPVTVWDSHKKFTTSHQCSNPYWLFSLVQTQCCCPRRNWSGATH